MPGGATGRQGTQDGADEHELADATAEGLADRQVAATLEEEERTAWRVRGDAVRE